MSLNTVTVAHLQSKRVDGHRLYAEYKTALFLLRCSPFIRVCVIFRHGSPHTIVFITRTGRGESQDAQFGHLYAGCVRMGKQLAAEPVCLKVTADASDAKGPAQVGVI